jgi:hypothetical protein
MGRNFRYNPPPDYAGHRQFVCTEWDRSYADEFTDSLSAKFVEVFNL